MFTLRLQSLLPIVLATLPTIISSSLYPDNSYAPAHEYKSQDYSFRYGVKDVHSGDIKQQWETKEGDIIKGSYSLIEPDGRLRVVDYTADKESGFIAVVKHKGLARHPETKESHEYLQQDLHKPVSHSEVNIKPNALLHYNHVTEGLDTQVQLPTKYNYDTDTKYEVKYAYPSQLNYEEALTAQQQLSGDVPYKSVAEASEAQSIPVQKYVHYYVPQVTESKQEESTNVPSVYLQNADDTETKTQSQVVPLDLSDNRQTESTIPVDIDSQDSEPQYPIKPSKSVYAAVKEKKQFSLSQLQEGFEPITTDSGSDQGSANSQLYPGKGPISTPGLGKYRTQPSKSEGYKYTVPQHGQRFYYLPSYYKTLGSLGTSIFSKTPDLQTQGSQKIVSGIYAGGKRNYGVGRHRPRKVRTY